MNTGVIQQYRELLPITEATPLISLGEGNTPLVRSRHLADQLGFGELYFKLEGCNPTGSFKDRGMVVAVAKAMESGSTTIICASTGNTSASAAAYGAHCGLRTVVLVPKGNVATGKLAQAIAHGSQILVIDGNFDQALKMVVDLSTRHRITLVNSLNPHRLQGQKTAAFEIVDTLTVAPDYLFIPVGNAGNITAYWMGFCQYKDLGKIQRRPKMMGFQAEGAAPIVRGAAVSNPTTVASAIRIGNPASWQGAIDARDESGGYIGMVSDDEIINSYKLMARLEGIFCEPASAASVAGLVKLTEAGLDLKNHCAVCVITGTGLKDPELASQHAAVLPTEIPADLGVLEEVLLSELSIGATGVTM
ncbi:threonine synthase [Dehalococcoidia bacterium]|nr:threonine synthase [Dehalococcoidia bacterium]